MKGAQDGSARGVFQIIREARGEPPNGDAEDAAKQNAFAEAHQVGGEHAGVGVGKFQAKAHQRFVDEKYRQHRPTHKGQNIGRAARHDDHHDHRHQRPPEQSTDFLHFGDVRHVHALGGFECFFAGDGSFLFVQILGLSGFYSFCFGRVGVGRHFGRFRQDEAHVLQRAECAAVGQGEEQGDDYRCPFKLRRK